MADIFDTVKPDIFDKIEPTFVESVKAKTGNAAAFVVRQAVGIARTGLENVVEPLQTAFGRTAERVLPEFVQKVIPTNPVEMEELKEVVKRGGEDWVANINAYWKTHPDEYYEVKSSGAVNVANELISYPGKLVGGIIESVPLMIEGYLGAATGVGMVAGMAIPMIGEEYATARDEGTPVMSALIRAISSGVGQAELEAYSLSKKIGIAKMIPKSSIGKITWEGVKAYARGYAQEGTQQFWDNINRWLFTDRRQDWFENVAKSAEVGGPLELAMSAGFAGMGAVGKQHKPAEQIKRLEVINQTVQEHPDFKPEQVKEISDEIKVQKEKVVQEYIEQIQERFPGEIKDTASLKEIGDAIAFDFGIKTDKPIVWKWKQGRVSKRQGILGYHLETTNEHVIPIFGNKHTDSFDIKKSIVHELGHIVEPPVQRTKMNAWEQRVPVGKRQVHTPAFKKWVAEHEKLLTEIVKVPKNQLVDKTAKEISTVKEPTVQDAEQWLTNELAKPERPMPPPLGETLAARGPSKKDLKALIHKIPLRILGWSDKQYRAKIKELTGKSSIKHLEIEQLQMVADYFQNLYGGDVTLSAEDYEKPITFMGKATTMSEIIKDVARITDELPSRTTIPEKIRQRVFGRAVAAKAEKARALLIGIDNSRPGGLAKMLGGYKDTILTQVFRENLIERPSNGAAAFHQSFFTEFQNFLQDNDLTPTKMSKLSASQHRWWMPVEVAKEFLGKGPDIIVVKFNGREYELTPGNALELYMMINQKDGIAHAKAEGIHRSGVYSGPISEEQLDAFKTLIESNPVLMKFRDHWYEIDDSEYFKKNINTTSQKLVGKDIAVVTKNYFPLSVKKTEKVGKKTGFTFREPPKRFNLLEDQSFLNPRKGPTGALDADGDFFQTLYDMAEGVADYANYAEPLRIARTVLAYKDSVKNWRQKGYEKIYNNLNEIIKNESETPEPRGWLERMILSVTRGATRALFAFPNIRTPAIQISSTTMLAKDFEIEDIKEGLKFAADPRNYIKTMKDIPWVWARFYMDRGYRMIAGMAETAGLTLPMQGKLSAGQMTGIALKWADLTPFVVLNGAVRSEYARTQAGKTKLGGLTSNYWTGKETKYGIDTTDGIRVMQERFTVGRRGQQSYDKFDRSVATSSHGTLSKIGYLFRSFTEGALNAQQEAYDDWKHSEKTFQDNITFARTTGAVLSSFFVEAAIRNNINWCIRAAFSLGLRGEWPEKRNWIQEILDTILGPVDMIPLVGDFLAGTVRRFVSTLRHEKPLYMGRIGEPLPLQVINTLAQAPDNFAQGVAFAINGEGDKAKKSFNRAAGTLLEGIAIVSGVNAYEVKRYKRLIEGEEESTSTVRRRRRR